MRPAERLYGAALLAYPRAYRQDRGEEILGVLMADNARFSPGQALALLRHGTQLRLRSTAVPGPWNDALAAAAVSVSALLTVIVVTAVTDTAAQAAWTLAGASPGAVWIDPLWPAYGLWVATFVLLMRSHGRAAGATAWLALGVQAAVLAGLNGSAGRLDGYPGGAAADVALLVPPLALALLLLRPARAVTGPVLLGRRRVLLALALGSVPAVADATVLGISTAWAPVVAVVVLATALLRAEVLPRAGVVIAFTFGWIALSDTDAAYGSGWYPQGTFEGLAAMAATVVVAGAVLLTVVRLLEVTGGPRALSRQPRRPRRDP